ncbi:unnamed protein product [Schistocephalus solidus]|uniref:Conserved oligomeric Golgi complex subunit 3 C-terminal domain-containing protein n=1 Tax=Schistocephalus solidus TaxID=70667 RepID=A0A3P7CBW4_SCHSO|nr:unnamed protein product [Schistocephalus solidus]
MIHSSPFCKTVLTSNFVISEPWKTCFFYLKPTLHFEHCFLSKQTNQIKSNEIALFGRFFLPDATGVLSAMLANICHCAYDSLRPFLIHANHIEILTDLCSFLKQEFLETESAVDRADSKAFLQICHNLLVDVQQRLIFCARVYIKSQIFDYSSSPGDLAYFEKLEIIEKISTEDRAQQKVPPGIVRTPTDFHGMCRCFDVESNCTLACIESLLRAEKLIAAQKTPSDGQLFLIKHLLVLREQLTPFNVELKVKETSLDFSDLQSAAYQALPIYNRPHE